MLRVPGELVRGGTSKCWIFAQHEVAATGLAPDDVLAEAFDAADPRQIDGVGGATSTTSKAALVSVPADPTLDVEFRFAQVGIGERHVEWTSNCGNCATAVALWAVHRGMVALDDPRTTVRMRNVNTGALLTATLPTPGGVPADLGEAGVVGTEALGVPVTLGFVDPAGATLGRGALPTGHSTTKLPGPHGEIEATLVDAGAPAALFDADALGLTGAEAPAEFAGAVPDLVELRHRAAVELQLAPPEGPFGDAVPKVGVVAPPREYIAVDGGRIPAAAHDLAVRMVSMHAPHPAIGLTSAVAVAVAAALPGTLVERARTAPYTPDGSTALRLGTPAGVVTVEHVPAREGARPTVLLQRAARRIATAELLVPTP